MHTLYDLVLVDAMIFKSVYTDFNIIPFFEYCNHIEIYIIYGCEYN